MDLTLGSRVFPLQADSHKQRQGTTDMRKAILGLLGALASPAFAADLSVQPRYSEVPGYEAVSRG